MQKQNGCIPEHMNRPGTSYSISFSGPKYMVQQAETSTRKHPTTLPNDSARRNDPMPHNWYSAT